MTHNQKSSDTSASPLQSSEGLARHNRQNADDVRERGKEEVVAMGVGRKLESAASAGSGRKLDDATFLDPEHEELERMLADDAAEEARHRIEVNRLDRQTKRFEKFYRLLLAVAALTIAAAIFMGGVYVGAKNSFALKLGYPVAQLITGDAVSELTTELAKRIGEVDHLISTSSQNPQDLEKATEGALRGLIGSLDDRYAQYYNSDEYQHFKEISSGQFGGIGVVLSDYEGQAYLVRVYEGTPAAEAGMQAGDFIVAINGDRKVDWNYEAVAHAVRGEPGKEVEITWRRPSTKDDPGGEEFTKTLTTSEITYPNVYHQQVGDAGYISVAQFNEKTIDTIMVAMDELDAAGVQGYILDLRGNPGGLLDQAIGVTSLFVKSGTVVEVRSRVYGSTRQSVTGNHKTNKPLVVLIDQGSASASEIVASALQDHRRALIVGTTSFGKGTVQSVYSLDYGGGLKLTIANYLSPDGHVIDQHGVTPDLIVEGDEGHLIFAQQTVDIDSDAQLAAAYQVLLAVIANSGDLNIEGLSNPPGSQQVDDAATEDDTDTQAADGGAVNGR